MVVDVSIDGLGFTQASNFPRLGTKLQTIIGHIYTVEYTAWSKSNHGREFEPGEITYVFKIVCLPLTCLLSSISLPPFIMPPLRNKNYRPN
jgi:hypothetical protein